MKHLKLAGFAIFLTFSLTAGPIFSTGNLVVSVEGNGVLGASSGPYTDNQAAPLSLFQYSVSGTSNASFVNSMTLPQTASGGNFAVSGEYGSSSEGGLSLSGNGKYLTIMGYGVNAASFNANPGSYSPSSTNTALGQSGSVLGQGYTAVPRVVALIDANGNVNSSTAVYNVFSGNNPRSAYTLNGTGIYISGQGTSGDSTGGVFYTTVGGTSAVSITGNDAGGGASQDTRTVQIYNGQLYVSVDSKSGSTNRSYIATLGTGTPTTLANSGNGPTMLAGFGNSGGTGKETITAGTTNGVNSAGQQINLSPEDYFFANATTLYVADSGDGKQTSGTSSLGDGGLQKWSLVGNSWVLDYTLYAGLNLVPNTNASGTTGLLGLTGEVIGNQVELFAINYTIGDTDPTYLYGITDSLSATTLPSNEMFTQLAQAPADSNFKGVAFAPSDTSAVPEPGAFAFLGLGLGAMAMLKRRLVKQ